MLDSVHMDILVLDADGVTNPLRLSDFSRFGLSGADAVAFFNGPFRERCLIGADTKAEMAAFARARGIKIDIDGLFAHWHDDQKAVHESVLAAIQTLRQAGVYAALATNQDPYRLAYMRTVMPYGDLFDQIFCSAEIGFSKPDSRFFLAVQAGLPQGRVHFIDDNEENVSVACSICDWEGHSFSGDYAVAAQLRAWWPEIL